MSASMGDYAVRYTSLGLYLAPLRFKVPIAGEGWNTDPKLFSTSQAAREYWTRNPDHNIGVCLEPSRLVSLDADYEAGARTVLKAEGIDLDELIATVPTIIGRAPRLEFRAPSGLQLSRKSLVWKPKVLGEKPVTVLEFRHGRLQDVFPPSIHPDTKMPYRWQTPPRNGFPVLPDKLLRLWLDFEAFKRRALSLCPWAQPEPEPEVSPPRQFRERRGPSVIDAFNDGHDAAAILEASGYQRVAKRRWMSPNGSGMAGVTQLPNGKIFCHHASDSELGDGHAHDAFDVFRILCHGGDYRLAVKTAAEALGMSAGK